MYYETLQVPHPRLATEERPEPLQIVAGLVEAWPYIHDASDKEAATEEVVEHIQDQVRLALRYPEEGDGSAQVRGTTFDLLRQRQITTCLGYTVVGSECMDAAGIQHHIGYANGHSFIVRFTDASRVKLVDMLTPKFTQDVTDSITRGDATTLTEQAASERQRGVAMFSTLGLVASIRQTAEELEQRHPWLAIGRNSLQPSRALSGEQERNRYISNHTCVLSVFPSEAGRQVLQDYAGFRQAVGERNLSIATSKLTDLRGLYPEIDARAQHAEIHQLVADLSALGEFDKATQAVDDYCASFDLSQDARLKGLEGDLLRRIVKASEDPEIATRSMEAYQQALERTRCGGYSSSMYLGRIASLNALATKERA